MNISWIENWTFLDLVMVIINACMLILELNIQVFLIMFIIECVVVDKTCKCSPNTFKHVSLWCLFFDPQRS